MARDYSDASNMRPSDEDNNELRLAGGEKLTSWANEPSVQDLKQDLMNAKPSHDAQMAKVRKWNNLSKVEVLL